MMTKHSPVKEFSRNLNSVNVATVISRTNSRRKPNLACGTMARSPLSYFSYMCVCVCKGIYMYMYIILVK